MLCKRLAAAISDSIILPSDVTAFQTSMKSYWAQQECEVVPACVVRPSDVDQLSVAIRILKREYDDRMKQVGRCKVEELFAIRSGGHSPVSGAASISGSVLIDLSLFDEVTPSEDGASVVIGAGAKWIDVSKVLDGKGLAVVGGRNSAVGVGGLALGGKSLLVPYIPYSLSSTLLLRMYRYAAHGLSFLFSGTDTKYAYRRTILLLPPLWSRLLQHSQLRNRPCLWCDEHSLGVKQR